MSVTLDTVLVQDKEPRAAELESEVVLLSLREGAYFGLNEVASEIWRMLAEPCRVEQMFDVLLENHEVDAETLERDVTPFLQTLVDYRLLRMLEPGQAR
jgi:Coenzyme PQQ synthesis protein D (PqqD)